MSTIDFVLDKFKDLKIEYNRMPIELPNVGRDMLSKWLHELDFKVGVEVGVAGGEYSEILCKENPQMHVYGIDPWIPYKGYRDYTRDSTFTKLYEETLKRMAPFPNYEIIKKFSMDALVRFYDNYLDFVYIDANHSEPFVTQDITQWYKKVRVGGILAGHDYARVIGRIDGKRDKKNWAVKDAIQNYTKENRIKPWFVLGAEAKIPGTIRDDIRSWMIVKR